VDKATTRTGPLPNIQIEIIEEMSTAMTTFGTGIEAINRYQGTAIPGRFVLQLADEFSPADIGNTLGQRVILQQVFDGQRLDTDHLVFADETSGQLVLEITASIGNAGMHLRYLATRLLPILGAFPFLRVASL